MKKKLFLSLALTFAAIVGVCATNTWPITLTTVEGLPGKAAGTRFRVTTPVYNFAEAVTTVRLTVVSTNTFDAVRGAIAGLSSGNGPGFPYFDMSELSVKDAAGKSLKFTLTSNAAAATEGSLDNLIDGKPSTYFHSTHYTGACPQAYHFIEIELAEAQSSFSVEWDTRDFFTSNLPTYVGITPGTLYLPFPEMNFQLGDQVTTVDELKTDGQLFVIKGNVEGITFKVAETVRNYDGGGYFHSPYGAAVVPSAADLVYLIPAGADNTYKVRWLTNDHFIGTCAGGAWNNWQYDEALAGKVEFIPCDTVPGDFVMKMAGYRDAENREYVMAQDGIIKMRTQFEGHKPNMTVDNARPVNYHFTIYKAGITGSTIKSELTEAIATAQARIDAYGGKIDGDAGEYDALVAAIGAAKMVYANSAATATEVMTTRAALIKAAAGYCSVRLFFFADSIDFILEDPSIEYCSEPNWVTGGFPEAGQTILTDAQSAALLAADNYASITDIDLALSAVQSSISSFWKTRIERAYTLPFRMNDVINGLPGTKEGSNWIWKSDVIYLDEATNVLRFTVFGTNTGGKYPSDSKWVFPTLGEFILFDLEGKQIPLTAESFTTNSLVGPTQGDGDGLAGLCDGDFAKYYHGAYNGTHEIVPTAYVYLEVTLPKAIGAFSYKQVGRGNGNNTPTDFVFGKGGVAITPEEVDVPDPSFAVLGEKVTNVSQLNADEFYAIYGNLNVIPAEGEPKKGCFYKGNVASSFSSACAFTFEPTGDGKFNIRSLFSNKYWKHSETTGGEVKPTFYKSEAAAFNITPSNNTADVLKDAFRFWYPKASDPTKAYVYQSWENYVGSYEVSADFSDDDKDGESEWFIYRMTMDNPYYYWLNNAVKAAADMGLVAGTEPGFYGGIMQFSQALEAAQATVDAGDKSKAKAAITNLNNALEEVRTTEINPIVDGGVYMIRSSNPEFFKQQGVHKSIFLAENDGGDGVTGDYKPYWGTEFDDSCYWFEFKKSTDYEALSELVQAKKMTAADSANAYTIRNVKYNLYLGGRTDLSKDMPAVEEPLIYVMKLRGAGIYNIWNPANNSESHTFHCESSGSGSGSKGDIVYWDATNTMSQWYIRNVSTTSIDDIVVPEGDEVVGVQYYTIGGAANSAPVKGFNIERTIYSNGVTRSKKIFIK